MDNGQVKSSGVNRLALTIRRGARFIRIFCVLSLAIASVLNVVNDFGANSWELNQTVISGTTDNLGTDAAQPTEACHTCSAGSYFNVVSSLHAMAASSDVPEGRLVQMSGVALRIAGPPPKN